ncbi:MAG TPA: peptidyl-prolyl cis-trans isomerase [Longimicrobiales bacterium]
MMRQMRDNMKVIMIITSATFVGLMVFGWGMDITGRGKGSNGVLGKVNGTPITYEEWRATYQNLYDQQQRASQDQISSTVNKQIEDAAWNQLVMQKLINQELERRGITVTDDEIKATAKVAPPPELAQNKLFQTNGQFDQAKYQQFLASPAVDNQLLLQLEAYYRDMIPKNKLYYQVTSGIFVPDSYLWTMWQDSHETAKVRFIALDPRALVPDNAVSVSDAEINDYYKKHQNDFQRPATAHVQAVGIEKLPNAQDTAAARDSALAIRAAVQKDTAQFATLAAKVSKDPGSAQQGGELGAVHKGQTAPAFDQALFSLPVGQISEPVLTQFGYHIIEVEKRNGDSTTVARHILIPITVAGAHLDQLLARADSMEKAGETMPIAEVASRLGLTIRTGDVTKEVPSLPGIGRVDEGVDWAFGDAQPKEVSQVFETPAAFYMLQLDSRTSAGPLPLSAATPTIRTILMIQKKMEKERVTARQMVDQIRAGQSMDQVAAARGTQVHDAGPFTRRDFVPGMGQINAAVGEAFGLNPGQIGDPVEANDAIYIVQTLQKTPADRTQFEQQKQLERARLQQAMAEQRWSQFLLALRQNAKIVDNRATILRPAAKDTTAAAGL